MARIVSSESTHVGDFVVLSLAAWQDRSERLSVYAGITATEDDMIVLRIGRFSAHRFRPHLRRLEIHD
ncbi:hypothetical protein AN416_31005 (plasmid) [Paraburkholderia caribensis]|nr:hypothetical protein AN416_31005 [Paraburkholderia caribensis]